MSLLQVLPWIGVGLLAIIGLRILVPLLKRGVRLGLWTLGSLFTLFFAQPVGAWLGVQLGVNLFNALVMAILGIPGFGLLLLLHWICI